MIFMSEANEYTRNIRDATENAKHFPSNVRNCSGNSVVRSERIYEELPNAIPKYCRRQFRSKLSNELTQDFKHIRLGAAYELRKHLRRKRILIAGVLAVVVPLIFHIILAATKADIWKYPEQYASNILGFAYLLIIISAVLFAGDSISGEFEKKTGLVLFATPQRRTSILVAKYLGAAIITAFILALFYLTSSLGIISLYGAGILLDVIKSYLVALLYMFSILSIAFLFSSILKSSISSILLNFFFLWLIMPIISSVLMIAKFEPWFIVTYYQELITMVFGGVTHTRAGTEHAGFEISVPDFNTGIIIITCYAVILFVLSAIIANRRGME